MKYKINTATTEEIRGHLKKVSLPGDAEKIRKSATTYEAWEGGLVGLLAVYKEGYITNLSVLKEHRNKGIASKLLKMASKKFPKFELETDIPGFYFKQGFKVWMHK